MDRNFAYTIPMDHPYNTPEEVAGFIALLNDRLGRIVPAPTDRERALLNALAFTVLDCVRLDGVPGLPAGFP